MFGTHIDTEELNSILALCNGFNLATILLSVDCCIVKVNAVAENLLLQSQAQLIDKPFQEISKEFGIDFFLEDDFDKIVDAFSKPTIHWISEKKFVDVHWNISRCFTLNECSGYLLVGKIMASMLHQHSLHQMENILRSIPVALYNKNIDGEYLFVNEYEARLAGYSSTKNMVGLKDENAPWQSEMEFIRCSDKLVLSENRSIIFNEKMTLYDGKKNKIIITKSPFHDEHANVIGIIGTCVIVSSQKNHHLPFVGSIDANFITHGAPDASLTKKEIECILWLIKGYSSSDIARMLNISGRTVETHLNNIKIKLNCNKLFQIGYLVGKYGYLLI